MTTTTAELIRDFERTRRTLRDLLVRAGSDYRAARELNRATRRYVDRMAYRAAREALIRAVLATTGVVVGREAARLAGISPGYVGDLRAGRRLR